jgi:hypothetical protein
MRAVEADIRSKQFSRDQIRLRNGVGSSTIDDMKLAMGLSGPYKDPGAVSRPPVDELRRSEEINGDNWTISLPKTRICTLDQLVEHCEIDLQVWEVERFVCNKWEVGAKVNDKLVAEPLFQVKAWLKQKRHIVDARAEIEALKAEAKKHMFVPKPVIYTTQDSDNLLELLIPDLHAAKLAYSKETGFQNYDTGIAIETYDRAIDKLIQRASRANISRIVLGVGNDVLQADNVQGTTFGGTKVDVDSRYRKSYKEVRIMFCRNIEKLRMIAPVDVKPIPGNHDTLSTFTLGDSLECKFDGYPDVFVDNQPIPHKLVAWGKVLLALMHGDKGKQADYGIWLATTYPEQFAAALFREIHVGHKHTVSLAEKFGIRVRGFGALCPPDEWHANNLFTGNLRIAEGLVWNKHEGLTNHFFHTEIDERAA